MERTDTRRDTNVRRRLVLRSLIAGLAVAAAALAYGSRPAGADDSLSVSGGGTRSNWTVTGNLRLEPDGTARGQFQAVAHQIAPARILCHWDEFSNASIVGSVAVFDGVGVCKGETEFGPFEFAAENRFGIVDNGEPGAGVDTIDVNFLGPMGVAIPGGVIEGGNFRVG